MQVIKFNVKKGRMPNGNRPVITLSTQKASRVIGLYRRYKEIGFTGYSLIDLAELSLQQWRRRDYPVPKGYKRSWGKILTKMTVTDLIGS